MIDSIKSIIIIISVCYGITCISKLVQIFKNRNYGKDGISMLDNIKTLSFEEFYTLAISFLNSKGFEDFKVINNNLAKCIKDNEEFLVFFDNNIMFFDKDDAKIFYGYMIAHNVKGIVLFTTGLVETSMKEFFKSLNDTKFIFYDKNKLMKDYKQFILEN